VPRLLIALGGLRISPPTLPFWSLPFFPKLNLRNPCLGQIEIIFLLRLARLLALPLRGFQRPIPTMPFFPERFDSRTSYKRVFQIPFSWHFPIPAFFFAFFPSFFPPLPEMKFPLYSVEEGDVHVRCCVPPVHPLCFHRSNAVPPLGFACLIISFQYPFRVFFCDLNYSTQIASIRHAFLLLHFVPMFENTDVHHKISQGRLFPFCFLFEFFRT